MSETVLAYVGCVTGILGCITGFASLVASLYSHQNTERYRTAMLTDMRYSDRALSYSGFRRDYSEKLVAVTLPDGNDESPSLRQVRDVLLNFLNSTDGSWDTFKAESVDKREKANKMAYEISLALHYLGVAAASGAIPLRLLFVDQARVILLDWVFAESLVDSIRAIQQEAEERLPTIISVGERAVSVPQHRRHGEWLALAAYLFVVMHDGADAVPKKIESHFRKSEDEVAVEIQERVQERFLAFWEAIRSEAADVVEAELKQLGLIKKPRAGG